MHVQTLSSVLMRDLLRPAGLTPCFGEEARAGLLLEHFDRERRMAGEVLQNIEALADCLGEYLAEYQAGRRSAEALAAELRCMLEVIDMELRYDEAEAMTRR
ncbi:hypothetical protein [Poseidonocella sp. HB161398]|uniref:hypothetical protein n=1 Tax=Poseidonocella sp. HB161398 TaxID=2320855 RepID=UPI001109046F|nr:hypothetical protein [Poseidonocella sp. HB161398]